MKNLTKSYTSLPSLRVRTIVLMLVIFVNQSITDAITNDKSTIDVGVILDLGTWVGRMTNSCISMALEDYYSTHNHTTRLVLHTRDSHRDVVDAASSAIDLIKNVQVQAILGPQSSSEAKFLIDIGNKTQVPVISFSATSPSISNKTQYFIRTARNDSAQVKAIAAIVQSFGWREVVPIYEDTDYGGDMIPYLTDAIQDVNARVPYRSILSPSSTSDQIRGELYRLMTMQTRVFMVHMTSSLSSRLFPIAKEVGMMTKGYVWIITDGLTELLSSMDASVVDSMQGVLGIKPHVPESERLNTFSTRWRRKFLLDNPEIHKAELNAFGLWAYDSVWALAMAVEKVNTVKLRFEKLNDGKNSTDLETLGISQIGPKLLESILQTNFNGLSGKFWIKDGQLQSLAFHIVNVIGKGGRDIGFWTPALGISRKLNQTGKKLYATNKDNLQAIIWPGESTVVPKGWDVSTSEKKLKIGVPVKNGFSEFVTVKKDLRTNATSVTGFCIDVFKAVTESMPYAIPYEFVPFAKDDGQSGGGYDELIDQIYFQIYDGVVGDVTIVANRSQHVDFTLPFTESGVSMVVPIKVEDRNAWIFLKPLTMDLWITTGIFFIITGFVVWVLEHRINEDFRGRPAQQIGMIFWFSFSTLVFAHKERVISNLARFVVIIWVFVVLILTSSYTASLTSMLTVQKYQPTVTDIRDLKINGDFVGYQKGSFVYDLMESMGFDLAKLRPYNTPEEYHFALKNGSRNGGVSAIVDEIPYIKLFLAKYCKTYMMVGPTHRTAGFGFVSALCPLATILAFPKGSPFVPDVSRAVLNVTQGEIMDGIDRAWFKTQVFCPDQGGSTITSDSLTLEDFKGLFLIAGVASSSTFLLFLLIFLYEQRTILTSEGSISQKISSMALKFASKRDITSGGSKKRSPERSSSGKERTAADYDTSTLQTPITCISLQQEDMVSSQEESFPCTEPSTRNQDLPSTIELTSTN